jgi:outer membrane protein TolC
MVIRAILAVLVAVTLSPLSTLAQDIKKEFTLEEVIQLAREQSLQAIVARHQYRADYWEFRSYKAKYLPKVTLRSELPRFRRAIKEYQNPDGSYQYIEENVNTSSLNLDLSQNIGLTGGQLFVSSDLQRIDEFGDNNRHFYMSTPISIGYNQPVLFYNEYKWEKQIEPLKYEKARKQYLSNLEEATINAVNYYFDLMLAQKNLEIARNNYANADTLYTISQKRYQIGTIAENELMQMKLSYLNAGADLNEAKINLKGARIRLRSFLGFNEQVEITLKEPDKIPDIDIEVSRAVDLAEENNPRLMDYEQQLLQAKRDVAKAKSEKGPNASLFASFGLTQEARGFAEVYNNPQNQQRFTLGLEIPLVDWGLGEGRYRMAQSRQDMIKTDIKRSRREFEQNVGLRVMKFNLQDEQVKVKRQAELTAQKRYDITKKRFLVGKVDVLDLNVASNEKDVAKRNYISALRNYWLDYFEIRQITLFNFREDQPLKAEFDEMIR